MPKPKKTYLNDYLIGGYRIQVLKGNIRYKGRDVASLVFGDQLHLDYIEEFIDFLVEADLFLKDRKISRGNRNVEDFQVENLPTGLVEREG